MASAGDTSCGWSQIGKSQSEQKQEQALMKQRKQKRMVSNRESARRSRMRKQKHLEDLTAEVRQLRKENSQILTALSVTTQHYAGMEAQNAVLRAQTMELGATLQSLNQILVLRCMHGTDWVSGGFGETSDSLARKLSMMGEKQPISTASTDMFRYCLAHLDQSLSNLQVNVGLGSESTSAIHFVDPNPGRSTRSPASSTANTEPEDLA
ncbi:hypothetical protein B296_00002402 [Ensete ventricosum]|uniref:BZIP domain-containing protein n=1 Tax=Ensete ventricosum TaxID=4639 RepID=A0A427ACB5_ENSVE|nr:hypothetical protein B296_00002402 [Ensete ventricosum]